MQTKTNPDVCSLHGTSDLKVEKRKLKMVAGTEDLNETIRRSPRIYL